MVVVAGMRAAAPVLVGSAQAGRKWVIGVAQQARCRWPRTPCGPTNASRFGRLQAAAPKLLFSLATFVYGGMYTYAGIDTSYRGEQLSKIRIAATAAMRGNRMRELKELMEEAKLLGDVELRDSLGRSLAMLAASFGKLQPLKYLLRLGADVRAVDQHNLSLLEHACWKNQVFVVQFLLNDCKLHPEDLADIFGLYPLHKAAGYGHCAVIDLLLDAGANVNRATAECTAPPSYEANSKLETPLAIASRLGFHDAMRTLLTREGCKVNQPDRHGETPLHHVMRKGDWRAAEILISAGANPHTVNHKNKTCLDLGPFGLRTAARTWLVRLFPTRLMEWLDP